MAGRKSRLSCAYLFCTALALPYLAMGADVTVDLGTELMTVDGYGVFSSMPKLYQKAGDVFWVDRPKEYEFDRLVTDLGATAIRFEISPDIYPVEGEPYDWTGGVFGSGSTTNQFQEMREYAARGCDRFIGTVWSPPCWMKYNGQCSGGSVLDPVNHDAFATFMADYAQAVKDSVGVELYAISVQNEPQFPQPYNSAIMSDEAMNDVINRLASKLDARGLSTRIFGAEHMFWAGIGPYTQVSRNPNLYAFAVHGYQDGVAQDYGTAEEWADLKNALDTNKRLWMTETTGGKSTLETAKTLHASITSGKVSLWTWWAYADNLGTYEQTDDQNVLWHPNGTYYGSKHFFRFARPDAKLVKTTCSDGALWTSAYKNTDGSVALVFVNTATNAKSVAISGAGLPSSYHVYRSSGTEKCAAAGTTDGSDLSVPAGGVVSIISGDPLPAVGDDPFPTQIAAPQPSSTPGELNIFGDDVLEVYLNGVSVEMAGQKSKPVSLVQGQNVIACKLTNLAWGGGLIGAMLLPGGDTLHTDGTWKLSYRQPGAGWTDLQYDDTDWTTPHQFGSVDVWPGFERWGTSAVNFYHWNAQWICGATKTYMRKEIDVPSGTRELRLKGNNFTYKVWVNGTMVGEGGPFTSTEQPSQAVNFTGTGSTMCIGLEIADAAADGNGVLIKAILNTTSNPSTTDMLDTTWTCWFDEQSGWSTMGFNDDHWVHPTVIKAYDPKPLGKCEFIYPGEFWFRKVFTSGAAGIVQVPRFNRREHTVTSVELYTIDGRRMDAATAQRRLGRMPNALILRKARYKDGTATVSRALMLD